MKITKKISAFKFYQSKAKVCLFKDKAVNLLNHLTFLG